MVARNPASRSENSKLTRGKDTAFPNAGHACLQDTAACNIMLLLLAQTFRAVAFPGPVTMDFDRSSPEERQHLR